MQKSILYYLFYNALINNKFMEIPTKNILGFFFYFLLPIRRESIVFRSNFRDGDFDGFTRLGSPESEKSHF